ncbi:putative zinc-binding metallopeptidase [Phocaeicola sp. HCN-40430]|uniref:zinc-binding metallopeptidase n=1 Tax=Phocaeicola sp. HCN-40430 TaxID=3134664 RepID=UPI0030C06C43
MKKFIYLLMMALAAFVIPSCSEEELNPESIFDTTSPQRNEFDTWILKNYTEPFNIDLKYRFEDIESDLDYNVVPARIEKSIALAQLVKYLWMDVYVEIAGHDFLASYCPKIMHWVGSPEYNASTGSMVLGTAEGGMKITLFNVNGLDMENPNMDILNEWYFKTMHHEFAHILHQTKNYSTEFNEITEGQYTGEGWVNVTDAQVRKLGFVTAYGSSEVNEDFVETIANYVVKSDEEWQAILTEAGEEGAPLILQKLEMVKDYLAESWNIDIQALHELVQERQAKVADMEWGTLN